MKKIKVLFYYCFTLLFIITMFSGCNFFYGIWDIFMTDKVPEDNLKITYAMDCTDYFYSNKVHVNFSHKSDGGDNINLYLDNSGEKSERILEGNFTKAAYNDGEFFVLLDDSYYVLDIDNYTMPESPTISYINIAGHEMHEDAEPEYSLVKYSYDEFNDEYPNNGDFEWFVCP